MNDLNDCVYIHVYSYDYILYAGIFAIKHNVGTRRRIRRAHSHLRNHFYFTCRHPLSFFFSPPFWYRHSFKVSSSYFLHLLIHTSWGKPYLTLKRLTEKKPYGQHHHIENEQEQKQCQQKIFIGAVTLAAISLLFFCTIKKKLETFQNTMKEERKRKLKMNV